jgi:hypothetical protein
VNLPQTLHNAAYRWSPLTHRHNDNHVSHDDESREARAERSLAHLEELLETRQRWRHRARVMAMVAVPLLLGLFANRARAAFA